MARDFSVTFDQVIFDRVFGDISYPIKLVDKREDFDESQLLVDADGQRPSFDVPFASAAKMFEWAEANPETEASTRLLSIRAGLLEQLEQIKAAKAEAEKEKIDWAGPTDTEIKALEAFSDWKVKFHLAWIRIILKKRPSFSLNSPTTDIDGIKVDVSATGELWLKHPSLKCTKRCPRPLHKLCCKWKKITEWTRLAKVTFTGLDLKADTKLTYVVQNSNSVVATPRFKKLRIDKDIFDKIPLEDLVNYFLRKDDEKVDILKPDDLELEFDSFGLKYGPKALSLPPSQGHLIVDVELKKI